MATTSAQDVYDLLADIQPSPRPVRDLKGEVKTLIELSQALSHVDSKQMESLDKPLRGCGKICKDLVDAYKKCMQRSSNNGENLRVWFKMRISGKTMDENRTLLVSYKSALSFALGEINL